MQPEQAGETLLSPTRGTAARTVCFPLSLGPWWLRSAGLQQEERGLVLGTSSLPVPHPAGTSCPSMSCAWRYRSFPSCALEKGSALFADPCSLLHSLVLALPLAGGE